MLRTLPFHRYWIFVSEGQPLSYTIINNNIVVVKEVVFVSPAPPSPVVTTAPVVKPEKASSAAY